MRDQFYMNNYEFHYATKIGLITFLGLLLLWRKKKEFLASDVCLFQMDWLVSLTPEKVWFFTWVSSNMYCFNISGHMVLIILYLFSAVPFTSIFQPDGLNLSDLESALVKYDNLCR